MRPKQAFIVLGKTLLIWLATCLIVAFIFLHESSALVCKTPHGITPCPPSTILIEALGYSISQGVVLFSLPIRLLPQALALWAQHDPDLSLILFFLTIMWAVIVLIFGTIYWLEKNRGDREKKIGV